MILELDGIPFEIHTLKSWVGAAISGAISLIGMFTSMSQQKKARKLANELQNPETAVSPEVLENLAVAEQMAGVGLNQAQYNNALQNIYRNQSGAMRGLAMSGRPTSVASILRQTNDATRNLDIADAQARENNQRFAMNARSALANDKNRVFNWDREQYMMGLQQVAGMRQASTQNMMGAIGLLGQSAIAGVYNDLIPNTRTPVTPTVPTRPNTGLTTPAGFKPTSIGVSSPVYNGLRNYGLYSYQ